MYPGGVADYRPYHRHCLHVAKQSGDKLAEHHPQSIHLQTKTYRRKHCPPNNDEQESCEVATTANNPLLLTEKDKSSLWSYQR